MEQKLFVAQVSLPSKSSGSRQRPTAHAIISDIHGNLEALTAVLDRIRQLGVEDLICLGDVVAYGADSAACLRMASAWPVVIAGDWDSAIINHDPAQFSPWANQHLARLKTKLASQADGVKLIAAAAAFLDTYDLYGCKFCHGTPYDNREFIFPEDVYNPWKLDRLANEFDHTLFVGHTHLPGFFISPRISEWQYIESSAAPEIEIRTYSKLICNVGSVGQPRDGDSRASFVVFDGNVIQFHRVQYDIANTIAKIKDDPDIDDIQGDRLPEGR